MERKDLISFSTEVGSHDTRIDRCKRHEGRTIVFITLCAVLCGYEKTSKQPIFVISCKSM